MLLWERPPEENTQSIPASTIFMATQPLPSGLTLC
jgi:hypothetical protein